MLSLLYMTKHISIQMVIGPVLFIKNELDRIIDPFLIEKFGITESQFRILTPIFVHGHTTQKSLADFWNVSEAAINRQVSVMIKKGLVIKKINKKDSRKTEIHLTPNVKKMIHTIYPQMDTFLEEKFRELPQKDRKKIVSSFAKIIKVLGINYPSHFVINKK